MMPCGRPMAGGGDKDPGAGVEGNYPARGDYGRAHGGGIKRERDRNGPPGIPAERNPGVVDPGDIGKKLVSAYINGESRGEVQQGRNRGGEGSNIARGQGHKL